MSDFVPTEATQHAAPIDPNKHVRYTYGMVLGKDDLEQEFAFHHGRDLWGMREVVGYGTVRGLDVAVEDDGANGPRISVKPGVALTPRGELVCVPSEQCASLNDWLAKQAQDSTKRILLQDKIKSVDGSPDMVALYVTLCYRDCPTDDVPIPGEPCRDEADAMAASRFADDFALELRLSPPDQLEETSVRDVLTWVRKVPLDAAEPADMDSALGDFEKAVRAAYHVDDTMVPPEPAYNDPPATLTIPRSNAKEFYRAALRVWVTYIRPRQDGLAQYVSAIREALTKKAANELDAVKPTSEAAGETRFINAIKHAAGLIGDHTTPGLMDSTEFAGLEFSNDPTKLPEYWKDAWKVWDEVLARWMGRSAMCAWQPEEGCVLLSRVDVPLQAANANDPRTVDGDANAVPVDQGRRPFVAHTRMLQEWLLSDVNEAGTAGEILLDGDVTDEPNKNRVIKIQNTPVSPTKPLQDQILQFDGTNWIPADPPSGGGPPPTPITLDGDVKGPPGTNRINQLQGKNLNVPAPKVDQVLRFDGAQWIAATLPPVIVPPPVPLDGDVKGPAGTNRINQLQGKDLSVPAPTANQVLVFDGTTWIAGTPPAATVTDVVTKPKGLPKYQIVAAGIVMGNGTSRPPVFNDLVMKATGPGTVLLRFKAYKVPDESFQYIVKAIGVSKEALDLTVVFSEFRDDGILMGAVLRNKPVQEIEALELMVEISRYEK